MLAGSTTLNSATAKFSAAQHGGKRIVVQGAGAAGGNLITTVASVQSATAVTLADPAATAVDGQYAYIGTRDYDITIIGGNPIRDTDNSLRDGPKGLYGYSSNSIRFRHVDRLSIQDVHGETYSGKYFVNVGDVTGVDIVRIEAEHTNSDVVHVNGPARDIRIRDIYSRGAGDDIVSLTGGDFQVADSMGDCNGSITDVVVENVRAHPSIHDIPGATGGRGVLVLAGQTLTQAHKFEASRVTIRNVNTALKGSPIFLGGDTQDVATSSGTYRDILVDGVVNEPVGDAPYQLVTIKDGDFGTVELRSVRGTGSARKALVGGNTNVELLRTIGMRRSDISDNGTVKKWEPIGVPAYGAPTSPSGVRAQTMDRRLAGVPIEMTSGTLFLSYMTIDEVAALASIRNAVITGTDGATLVKASFFGVNADGTLTRLAQSGSSTTVWNAAASGQSKTLNMQGGTAAVSPFKQFAVGLLYVGPTPPTLAGCKAGNATEAGSDDILGKVVTGLTDIPATIAKSSLLDPPGGALIYSRVF
ncbi:hypothetical protein GS474_16095 [Rhodococcus hoagii]|nr:hypothetical protein [Prescottella equi]